MQPHESHQVPTFISRHLFSGPALERIPSPEWSGQQNQIAIIANKSIIVLTPGTFSRSSKTKSCLSFDTSSISIGTSESDDTPEQICAMQREMLDRLETEEDVFLAKMDRLISCEAGDSGSSIPFSCSVRSAAWSPCLRHNFSILSVLTCTSGILLLQKRQNKWITLDQQQDYVRKTLRDKRQDDLLSQVKSYEQLKDHFYRTGITALTWTAPDATDEFTFLITGSKSGFLFFWKVRSEETGGGRVELRHEWNSGLGHVTRLLFSSDYLLIGTHSGQVAAVNLSSLYSPGDVSLRPVFVWEEEDDLSADHFLTYKLPAENSFLIVLPKGTFLVLIRVSLSGGANEALDRREVVIDGRHQMPVTGMCETVAEDGSPIACLISSADGLLTRVRIPVDPFAATACIQQEEVTVEGLLKSRSAIYGLASSPFRVLTAALQTIIPYRDTSIMREGSILLIFPNVSFAHTAHWLSAQEKHAVHSPAQAIEYIMAYRAFLDRGEPYDMDFLQSDFTTKSISSLKVTRHKILAVRDFLAKDGDKHQSHTALLTNTLISIENLIFRTHSLQQNISSASGEGENGDQRESLSLMRFWYRKTGNKGAAVRGRSTQSSGSSPCPICSKALPLDGEHATCPDGHVFSRCSSSLLVCDPASCRIDCCYLCHRCYRLPAVWEMKYPCVFCY